ncbi:hypothetical protein [Prauserella shujinwangii]|uniref:hypothetical protein n=1 Tax=Prauserella shujinwangii TaxID=1453103 RepID=UPI000D062011|nr:hypothetical protein [Prauserella shujinwangii]
MSVPTAVPPPARTVAPPRFGGLARAAVLLGVVGLAGSAVHSVNRITVLAAVAGILAGAVALFGGRRALAAIGTASGVTGVVLTVAVQLSGFDAVDRALDRINSREVPAESAVGTVPTTYVLGDTHRGASLDLTVANPRTLPTGALAYDVTIANRSGEAFPLALLDIRATVGSTPAARDAGLPTPSPPELPPGQSVTFAVAFTGPAEGEVLLQLGSPRSGTVYFSHMR